MAIQFQMHRPSLPLAVRSNATGDTHSAIELDAM